MINYKKVVALKENGKTFREIVDLMQLDVTPDSLQRATWDFTHKGIERELTIKKPRESKKVTKAEDKPLEITREEILDRLKKGATLSDFGGSERVVKAHIEDLQDEGYCIEEVNGVYKLSNNIFEEFGEHEEEWNGEQIIKFGLVSDTHLCSKYQQITFLNEIYDRFAAEEIKNVYHAGDITDGYYSNRSQQIYELFKHGADEQVDYVVDNYPRREGITTSFIIGNHDNTHIINGGINIGKQIALRRSDMKYLGHSFAKVWITPKCDLDLVHPIDGSAYALSYSGQKYCDSISGGEKPRILAMGHHHKFFYMFYRNIHFLEVPCGQLQTPFMRGKKLQAYVGALICTVNVDQEGTIQRFNCELLPLYKALENDF